MAIGKPWLCVCLAWATLGGTILYFTDHSLVGGAVWLAVAVLMGLFGQFFLERLVEIIPRRGERLPADPFFILPVVALVHGTLVGPLIGSGAASGSEGEAWRGALLGGILGPPVMSVVFLVVCGVSVLTKKELTDRDEAGKPPVTWPHRCLIVLMSLVMPVVVLVVLVRSLLWIPRRRGRMRVYTRLEEIGGVFGADPEADRFYGVRLEGPAIGDADVAMLRVFPELDHVTLAGTQVTDAGLSYLRRLRSLKIVGLAHTAITDAGLAHLAGLAGLQVLDVSGTRVGDAGLEHLQGLGNLKYLDLRGTQVTEGGVERLLARLPDLRVKR